MIREKGTEDNGETAFRADWERLDLVSTNQLQIRQAHALKTAGFVTLSASRLQLLQIESFLELSRFPVNFAAAWSQPSGDHGLKSSISIVKLEETPQNTVFFDISTCDCPVVLAGTHLIAKDSNVKCK